MASSVLLPGSYTAWDEATLRVVLTHERAHVRQRDFYVHLLTGLHCALFWFNPLSWWLQRQLAELGEALSDCAAVEQAESRASYAETLLAFATRGRAPFAGVAMAGTSNLTPRIERLLNDGGFERSFAGKRRLPVVAAAVVVLAMFASTSIVRVTCGGRPASPLNAYTARPSPGSTMPSPAVPGSSARAHPPSRPRRPTDTKRAGAHSSRNPPRKDDARRRRRTTAAD